MEERYYLLSLEALLEGEPGLVEEAFEKVDPHRQEKAAGMRCGAARAACLGAGLLLQLAAREALEGKTEKILRPCRLLGDGLAEYDPARVIACLGKPIPLGMEYGKHGKPYLAGRPFYFNLSHSGSYVCCGVAGEEIGVDIQRMEKVSGERLDRIAGRFFCRREQEALSACPGEEERRELFYRLWTRKEAYGKLTGEGILAVSGSDVTEKGMEGLRWRFWDCLKGYRMAACTWEGKCDGAQSPC